MGGATSRLARLERHAPTAAASLDLAALMLQRATAIGKYRILDTPPEPDFDDIARLAATVCGTDYAAISFVGPERQWFKAEFGLGCHELPADGSFCSHTIEQPDVFVVPDAHADPRFADSPLVTGPPFVGFYAGKPIYAADGTAIAALCVFDQTARPGGLTGVQTTTLDILGRQVEALLELRRAVIERDRYLADQATMAERLRWLATHDALTGLPNRTLFHGRLRAALDEADRGGTRTALLMIDVDHFKQVNDCAGHDAGDAVLQAFAERLESCLGRADTIARQGGDEFAVVVPDAGDDAAVAALVAAILDRLRAPLWFGDRLFDCRASIGVAVYPDAADGIDALIKHGDLALGAAKAGGRDRAVVFQPEMMRETARRAAMLSLARGALDAGQIAPYYQPKIDLRTGALAGFEALLRWEAPSTVLLPETIDAAFIDRELSGALSVRMRSQILADMRRWLDGGVAFGRVAINSSAADFAGNDFAETLLAACAAAGVPPRMIEVEVTENVFLGRASHHVLRALALLRTYGVRVALDDFGTGFASLTHLKHFKVDVLKIDRSFIAGLGVNRDDAAIVRAVIMLGRSLIIQTVAEGIETAEQADYVRSKGCVLGQGFLFGGAAPARDVPGLVGQRARTRG